jgi:protein-tyrosine phosphatase
MNNENNTHETDNTTHPVAQIPAMDEARIAEINEILEAPRAYSKPFTETTWSQVLPGLYQGGTDDADVVRFGRRYGAAITKENFDLVVTMYAEALPVDWWVQELRYAIYDGDMNDVDLDSLKQIVFEAHRQGVAGRRVLVRCQAGWNRSGLVTCLVLIRAGFTPDEAIHLIRRARGGYAMSNSRFEHWLRTTDLQVWKA